MWIALGAGLLHIARLLFVLLAKTKLTALYPNTGGI